MQFAWSSYLCVSDNQENWVGKASKQSAGQVFRRPIKNLFLIKLSTDFYFTKINLCKSVLCSYDIFITTIKNEMNQP